MRAAAAAIRITGNNGDEAALLRCLLKPQRTQTEGALRTRAVHSGARCVGENTLPIQSDSLASFGAVVAIRR